jgi:hypothetical protein
MFGPIFTGNWSPNLAIWTGASMKLRKDPYQVFRFSRTPAGLYARQKWLGEAQRSQWKMDFQETVSLLVANQSHDGSWHHETVTTIKHLFGLHLTVRSSNAQTEAALTWLMEHIEIQKDKIQVRAEDVADITDLTSLPFVPGRPDMFLIAATLFLFTIFGRENDPEAVAVYRWLKAHGIKNKGLWFDHRSSNNIFRAMVVHPVFAKDNATALAVRYHAELQTDDGGWGDDSSFYQTLNALAHLDLPQAEKQLERAFKRLYETQNRDGTWSQSEPEWNTFLAVHALKNKGLL